MELGLQAIENEGLTPRIDGMIWHQGESDAVDGRTTEEYAADLEELVEAIRGDVPGATDMPFVIGRLSDLSLLGSPTGRDAIQAAQDDVASTVDGVDLVYTDSFRLGSDNLHYDALGQHAMGVRFALQLVADRPASAVSRFDLGTTDELDQQAGWIAVDTPDLEPAPFTAEDEATGFRLTLGLDPEDPGLVTRHRGNIDSARNDGFTLDSVYVDFSNVDFLEIEGLDPNRTYDIEVIMFDDHTSDNQRVQTVFDITGGASDELGTSHGPGVANNGILDDHAYSVTGVGLVPLASGRISLHITNNKVFAAVVNGVVITERP